MLMPVPIIPELLYPAVSSSIVYAAASSQANIDPDSASYTGLPTPIAGQKCYLLLFSRIAPPAAISIGGSTTGVTQIDQIVLGASLDYATVYEKVGWESTTLAITIDYSASSLYSVYHAWRTSGWDYVPGSLVAGRQNSSDILSTVLALTKAAGNTMLMGTRKYEFAAATPTPTVDFTLAEASAFRMAAGASFSGNVTFTRNAPSEQFKLAAGFSLVPE